MGSALETLPVTVIIFVSVSLALHLVQKINVVLSNVVSRPVSATLNVQEAIFATQQLELALMTLERMRVQGVAVFLDQGVVVLLDQEV